MIESYKRSFELEETKDYKDQKLSIVADSSDLPEAKKILVKELVEFISNESVNNIKLFVNCIPQLRIRIEGLNIHFLYDLPEPLKKLNPQIWLFKYSQYSSKKRGNRWAHPPTFGSDRSGSWYGGENKNGLQAVTEFPLTHLISMRPEHWFVSRETSKPLTAAASNGGKYDNIWKYSDIVCNRKKNLESLKTEAFKFAIVVNNPFATKASDNPFVIGPLSEVISLKIQKVNKSENPVKARFSLHTEAIRSSFISAKY